MGAKCCVPSWKVTNAPAMYLLMPAPRGPGQFQHVRSLRGLSGLQGPQGVWETTAFEKPAMGEPQSCSKSWGQAAGPWGSRTALGSSPSGSFLVSLLLAARNHTLLFPSHLLLHLRPTANHEPKSTSPPLHRFSQIFGHSEEKLIDISTINIIKQEIQN